MAAAVIAHVDTNVVVRYLTDEPPAMARRAERLLTKAETLLLSDVIFAETAYVLESYYKAPRHVVAERLRSVLAFDSIETFDEEHLLRALELYETHKLGFQDAYLAAGAEFSPYKSVASFDRDFDKVGTVERIEPR